MDYTYKTRGTCSQLITFTLDGDVVHNIKFTGGCHGNLQALSRMAEGLTVDEIISRIEGIRCGMKSTSCGDQLAKALREARDSAK